MAAMSVCFQATILWAVVLPLLFWTFGVLTLRPVCVCLWSHAMALQAILLGQVCSFAQGLGFQGHCLERQTVLPSSSFSPEGSEGCCLHKLKPSSKAAHSASTKAAYLVVVFL